MGRKRKVSTGSAFLRFLDQSSSELEHRADVVYAYTS